MTCQAKPTEEARPNSGLHNAQISSICLDSGMPQCLPFQCLPPAHARPGVTPGSLIKSYALRAGLLKGRW